MAEQNTGSASTPAPSNDEPKERALNAKLPADAIERAMNAYYGTANMHPRWRDFVEAAITEYSAKLEDEHNNGEPFAERPTDTLPRGRKVGFSPHRR